MPEAKVTPPLDVFQKLRHDLRGKLNGILGSGQVLLDAELDNDQKRFLHGILVSGDEMLALIDRITPELINPGAGPQAPSKGSDIISDDVPEEELPTAQVTDGQHVLIIDDEISNLDILVHTLGKSGYNLHTANSADAALQLLQSTVPHLILMDVMLPGKNGIDLCREIKALPALAEVPVIFLSGASDLQARLRAYEAGGVDFILKPFYAREVIVRVNTHLQLVDARKRLERYAHSLESLVKERTEQLIHQDRMASLGLMSAGVVHEIKNPVTFVKGNIAILRRFEADLDRILKRVEPGTTDASKASFIQRELPALLKDMESGVQRISAIIESLKAFSRKEPSEKTRLQMVEPIEEALKLTMGEIKRFQIKRQWPSRSPYINGNAQQLSQAFVNLFVNAAHAMEGKSDGCISIAIQSLGGKRLSVRVSDNGSGMTPETLSKIWLPFFTTKPKGVGTGLGMAIVHGIIEDHGGQISVASQLGEGTVFELNFPESREGDLP